jgi:hypothetical protein
MRLMNEWSSVVAFALLLAPASVAQSVASEPALSPGDLVRAVIANDLRPQGNHSHWMYEVDKEQDGKKQTSEVVQTRQGLLERLIALDGSSLSSEKQREEVARITKLLSHVQERQKLEEARRKDTEQCETFFKMIPDAFLFTYEGRQGEMVKLGFKPNPSFQPSSREARVLHAMEGEIMVQAREQRLAGISGHLMEDVKFGGGLLGYLEKGGTFSVKRIELAPSEWMMETMDVNVKGKALFFKAIAVQQKEHRSNFRRVADDLTLTDAAQILTAHVTLAANR